MQRRLAAILAADMVGYSRFIEADEEGTIARHQAFLSDLFEPEIRAHTGRMVKTMGDGLLVEFASVVQAVKCALALQQAMAEHEDGVAEDRRIRYRVGINLGDVVIDGDDILGDGVNVAARLEGLAEPGGICASASVHDQVRGKLDVAFADLGMHALKNIAGPVHVFAVTPAAATTEAVAGAADWQAPDQQVRFCAGADGVQIAYAVVGSGPPLVKAANWLNHLEYDWESPIWRHLLHELARDHTLIRYDERGNGLSDWDADDISLDAFVEDLATVVDAAGLARFPLLGISQGCGVSLAYAVQHPARVSHLVLYGGYARGRKKRGSPEDIEEADAILTLIRQGWGGENPAYRQIFTSRFIPDATPEQVEWFNDLQRITASPESAYRLRQAMDDFDVGDLLGEVTVPTLVLHCRDDAAVPFEEGRRIAAGIPGARFVALEGRNHLMLADEPACPRFLAEVRSFLAD